MESLIHADIFFFISSIGTIIIIIMLFILLVFFISIAKDLRAFTKLFDDASVAIRKGVKNAKKSALAGKLIDHVVDTAEKVLINSSEKKK